MNTKLNLSKTFAIVGLMIFVFSLFLPYRIENKRDNPIYSGIDELETFFPFMSLWIILPLVVLAFIKHSHLSKWLMLTFSILLFFPTIPIQFLFSSYCVYCESKPDMGCYVLVISAIAFLLSALIKMNISINSKIEKTPNILDNI